LRRTPEKIAVRNALHRVTSAPILAERANPARFLSAMDGIAVDVNALQHVPVELPPHQWQRINTGEVVPDQYNAVIKIEQIQWNGNIPVIEKAPEFLENIRRPGEDFPAATLLFSADHDLHPQDLTLLLAAGCESINVYRKPIVTFIPTGSELTLA